MRNRKAGDSQEELYSLEASVNEREDEDAGYT